MALPQKELNTIAARMLADYDAVTPGLVFAEGLRLDIADAWCVQSAVTRLREARGEKVIGYKVGAVSPGNQKLMGVPHPVWGRLWQAECHRSGAALLKSNYANLAIEAEFGVTLARDVKPGCAIDEIAASVSAVYPVLELHNLVLHGDQPQGHELIANNCINCGVVRGEAVTDLENPRLTDLALLFDNKVVDNWESLRWPDDILAAVDWLATALSETGAGLKAGDLILTGAWGPPIPLADHTRLEVRSSEFGLAHAFAG